MFLFNKILKMGKKEKREREEESSPESSTPYTKGQIRHL
jgi:hypothetical protein